MTATEYQLSLVDWQFFGTATWRSSTLGSCRSRENDLWGFLKEFFSLKSDLEFFQIPIVVRWERGEIGERPHAHYLVAGILPYFVNISTCFRANNEWNKSYGHGKVRLFDSYRTHSRVLAAYTTKTRSRDENTYEIGKFDHADRLVVNDAAWRRMLSACTDAPYTAQARTL